MSKWWKAPVLQGPENDYGDYDYLIEEIPGDSITWSKWERKCGECGKTHMWNLCHTHCFRTMDGWDSIDHYECWLCYVKRKLREPFRKIKNKIKNKISSFIFARKELHNVIKVYEQTTGQKPSKEIKSALKRIYRSRRIRKENA